MHAASTARNQDFIRLQRYLIAVADPCARPAIYAHQAFEAYTNGKESTYNLEVDGDSVAHLCAKDAQAVDRTYKVSSRSSVSVISALPVSLRPYPAVVTILRDAYQADIYASAMGRHISDAGWSGFYPSYEEAVGLSYRAFTLSIGDELRQTKDIRQRWGISAHAF